MKQIMKPRILLSALLVWVHIAMLPVTIRAEGMTQQQADAILEELKGIRQLLQQQQTLLRRQNTTQRAPAEASHRQPCAAHSKAFCAYPPP